MTSLHEIFSLVCGQEHSWVLGGQPLPFCQRCTGLYVGAIFALPAFALFRPKPTGRVLWVHGIFLLQMIPFGYHLVPQTGAIRMLTGQLFAVGLVYYLMLLPSDFLPLRAAPLLRHAEAGYFATTAATFLLLGSAVIWGGFGTNAMLSWTGLAGLFLYSALVLLNVIFIAMSTRGLLLRQARSSET